MKIPLTVVAVVLLLVTNGLAAADAPPGVPRFAQRAGLKLTQLPVVDEPVWTGKLTSRVIVLRHGGQVLDGLSHYEQLDEQIIKFLDSADPREIYATALEQMLPPPSAIEGRPRAP